MSWRLMPEERRIIERTQREGVKAATPAGGDAGADCDACRDANGGDSGDVCRDANGDSPSTSHAEVPLWRSMLPLIAGIALFVLLALLMVWVGSLFG